MLSVVCKIVIAVFTVMSVQEEQGCNAGLESLDKHVTSSIVMLNDVIKGSLLHKGQNGMIKNIVCILRHSMFLEHL